jgi:hypothetical protein
MADYNYFIIENKIKLKVSFYFVSLEYFLEKLSKIWVIGKGQNFKGKMVEF